MKNYNLEVTICDLKIRILTCKEELWEIYKTLEKGKTNIEIPKELVWNFLFSDLVFFVILLGYDIVVLPKSFPDNVGMAFFIYAILLLSANLLFTLLFFYCI